MVAIPYPSPRRLAGDTGPTGPLSTQKTHHSFRVSEFEEYQKYLESTVTNRAALICTRASGRSDNPAQCNHDGSVPLRRWWWWTVR